ncbi:cytidine deaminase [Dyadobacter psychrotolerans]|uniref:Cytidine deaminase n=1 Tax=Dyadobacter psychrotolerans TaxID=2541721 RepID=A0A4R5DL83_9BACT|nr:cytidine deaminase [Dyadobacter psychrotolerans]TDE14839.1 cytidine deaminase [Dyadobacter psychrotolerans]
MKQQVSFDFQLLTSDNELDLALQNLLAAARSAVALSYAPYSKFHVGAAILLQNGEIVKGGNQENASFPAGICAERVALSAVSSLFPSEKIQAIAIAYTNAQSDEMDENILSPCGICRQSILEVADRQSDEIQILLSSPAGKIILIDSARHLLPLAFSSSNL